MEFDEYEYLEKTVDDSENRNGSSKRKDSGEKREKGHRRREEEDEQEEVERRRRKHSRNEEENGDRKRDERERSERRKEREDRRRSDKDADKDKDRDRDRERRDRDKDREKDKERDRRSSSRSKRHDSREREREKERERERELREREREIAMRDGRRFKDKKESEPEADPERDQRTVFAYQMPLKATERDVYEFFSKAGKVRDVRVIMDRNSRRSKGVGDLKGKGRKLSRLTRFWDGQNIPKEPRSAMFPPYNFKLNCMYIEFYDAMSVPMAITLSGQLLLGQPVMVKPSEAEKNLIQPSATSGGSSVIGPADRKLYVGNLHFNMTEQQLRQIFEPFGPVELVQLPLDLETGQCKGFGFVQFAQVEHAKAAVSLNGNLEIAGRVIKVSSVTEHVSAQDAGTAATDLDDDEGGGLTLNAQSRAMLMQKLDRTGTASGITGPLGAPGLNGLVPVQSGLAMPINGQAAFPTGAFPGQPLTSTTTQVVVGSPTECLMLQNLFDPATESDPEFFLDVKEDVEGECSKFGRVEHIYVDRSSAGHVYLRFENKEAAMNAQRAMHNRWFAQKLISAIFLQPYEYEAKCRDSA